MYKITEEKELPILCETKVQIFFVAVEQCRITVKKNYHIKYFSIKSFGTIFFYDIFRCGMKNVNASRAERIIGNCSVFILIRIKI